MKYKLICCEVFLREICLAVSQSLNTIDPEFTPKAAHEQPDALRQLIQGKIDALEQSKGYDAVLLVFGLCGNSTAGIKAGSVPVIIPRAHDCCTIFLGSKEKFIDNFKDNPSAEWTSSGYMERGDTYLRETDTGKLLGMDKSYQDLVQQYGEDNAKHVWESIHPAANNSEFFYIEVPETSQSGHLDKAKSLAGEQGMSLRIIKGDMRLLRGLLEGNWDEKDYLIIPPGKQIKPVYDHIEIITSE